jgi:hypothetical protein
VQEACEGWDGVLSLHNAKAAQVIARLYGKGLAGRGSNPTPANPVIAVIQHGITRRVQRPFFIRRNTLVLLRPTRTFHRFVKQGLLPRDWAGGPITQDRGEFGE